MLFTGNAIRLFALTTIAAAIADAAPSTLRPTASRTRHRARSTDAQSNWDGCQYHVEGAGDFTSHFSFDFTTMDTLPDEFVPSTYEVGSGPYAPYAHIFNPDNIVLEHGQPMQMIVPGGQTADPLDTCQFVTRYDDVLYASVRTVAQVSPVNGTVHGFFMYMNDTQETDIEIRTGDLGNVHLTNQQTHFGNGETTYAVAAPADMTSAFHEYRYDWLPTVTKFYIDGELVMEISRNVPSEPGWLMWNNWANGYAWTWGPPLQDNILLINSVEAYFNRTSVDVSSCEAAAASSGSKASAAATSAGTRVTLNAAAASSQTSAAAAQTSATDAGTSTITSLAESQTPDIVASVIDAPESSDSADTGVSSTDTPQTSSTTTFDISSTTTLDVISTSTSDIPSTNVPDISTTTPDVSPTTTSDVSSSTTSPDDSSTTSSEVSSITSPDVLSTTTSFDVSLTTTPDISYTTTSDVSLTSSLDVSYITTPDVSPTSAPDFLPTDTTQTTMRTTSDSLEDATETSTSASATPTAYTDGSTPVVAGVSFTVQTDTSYSGTLLYLLRKRTVSTVDDCLRTCAASSSCVGTAFDSSSSTCSYYSAFDKNSKTTNRGVTFATVQDRGSDSSSVSAAASTGTTSTDSLAGSSTTTTDSTLSSTAGNTQVLATSSPAATSSASSSSTIILSISSSTTSATPTPTVSITCPDSNGTLYTEPSSNLSFYIECGIDHAGGDLSMVYVSDLAGCIAACAQTSLCVDVSLSGAACYMKKSVGSVVDSGGILGARLSTSTTSTATSTSASATATYTRPAFQQLLQSYIDARLVIPSS